MSHMENQDSLTPTQYGKMVGMFPDPPHNPLPTGGYMDAGFDWVVHQAEGGNSTYEYVMGMIEDLSDDDYMDFCYEMDIDSEDMEELSSFVMRNYDSNRVMRFLKDRGMVEGYQAENFCADCKSAEGCGCGGKRAENFSAEFGKPIEDDEEFTTMQVRIGSPSGSTTSWNTSFNIQCVGNEDSLSYLTSDIEDLVVDRVKRWNGDDFDGDQFGDFIPMQIVIGSSSGNSGSWYHQFTVKPVGDEDNLSYLTSDIEDLVVDRVKRWNGDEVIYDAETFNADSTPRFIPVEVIKYDAWWTRRYGREYNPMLFGLAYDDSYAVCVRDIPIAHFDTKEKAENHANTVRTAISVVGGVTPSTIDHPLALTEMDGYADKNIRGGMNMAETFGAETFEAYGRMPGWRNKNVQWNKNHLVWASDSKAVREAIKTAFPEQKFSVRIVDGQYIDVAVKSGTRPADIQQFKEDVEEVAMKALGEIYKDSPEELRDKSIYFNVHERDFGAEMQQISDDEELFVVRNDMGQTKGFVEMEDDLEDESIEIEISDDEMNEIADITLDTEFIKPSRDWFSLALGTAAVVIGGSLFLQNRSMFKADGDEMAPVGTGEPSLVAHPSTGDLLPADYEEMIVESTGYAVPIIPVSLDPAFMGSRFHALPTDRTVESNEPGIGAHTDVAMTRDTDFREPSQAVITEPPFAYRFNADGENCECSLLERIKSFFTGKSCCEGKEVKEANSVTGQTPYFGVGFDGKNTQTRVIKETNPVSLDPSTAPYIPQNLSGYTGQAYTPPTVYSDMMNIGVSGQNPAFVSTQSSSLQSVHGNLSAGMNQSYTDGSRTMSLSQWSIDYDVSQTSDSEAFAVSRSSGVRTMIRRV